MPDNLTKKIPQDASRINIHQEYEMNYWADKFGCTKEKIKKAVKEVGDSVEEVKKYLQSH